MNEQQLQRLPTDQLDRMAFGRAEGVQRLPLDEIQIRYQDDYQSALDYVEQCPDCYEEALDHKPVDVALERGVYWLEDGHHRFVTAQARGDRDILANLTIKDNPVVKLMSRQARLLELEYLVDDSYEAVREIAQQLRQRYGRHTEVPTRPAWVETEELWDEFIRFHAHLEDSPEVEELELAISEGQRLPPIVTYDGVIQQGHAAIEAAHNLGIQMVPVIEAF